MGSVMKVQVDICHLTRTRSSILSTVHSASAFGHNKHCASHTDVATTTTTTIRPGPETEHAHPLFSAQPTEYICLRNGNKTTTRKTLVSRLVVFFSLSLSWAPTNASRRQYDGCVCTFRRTPIIYRSRFTGIWSHLLRETQRA